MGIMQAAQEDALAAVLLDKNGHLRSANAEFLDMFGFANREIPGKNFRALLAPTTPSSTVDDICAHVTQQGEDIERSFEAMKKNGTFFPVSVQFSPDKQSAAGGVVARITALSDSVGIITIDEYGQIENGNSLITKIFGYKVGGVPGCSDTRRATRLCAAFLIFPRAVGCV